MAGEVELHGGGRREAHLDLLEADVDQQREHAELLLQVHRIDERLVAVAEVDAAPDRCAVDGPVRPGAVRQIDLGERPVFVDGASLHGSLLILEDFQRLKKSPGSSVDRVDRQAWAASCRSVRYMSAPAGHRAPQAVRPRRSRSRLSRFGRNYARVHCVVTRNLRHPHGGTQAPCGDAIVSSPSWRRWPSGRAIWSPGNRKCSLWP